MFNRLICFHKYVDRYKHSYYLLESEKIPTVIEWKECEKCGKIKSTTVKNLV